MSSNPLGLANQTKFALSVIEILGVTSHQPVLISDWYRWPDFRIQQGKLVSLVLLTIDSVRGSTSCRAAYKHCLLPYGFHKLRGMHL